MAKVIRVSGTKVYTPKGDTTVSSPNSDISLDAQTTVVEQDLYVRNDTTLRGILDVTGDTSIASTTQSYSTDTGALKVGGGVGLGGNLNVGGKAIITGTITVIGNTATLFIKENDDNVGNPYDIPLDVTVYGQDIIGVGPANAQRQEGAVFIAGGLGIQKDLNVGGFIYGRITNANTSLALVVTATNVDAYFYPMLSAVSTGFSNVYVDNTTIDPGTGGLRYNPNLGKLELERIEVTSDDTSEDPLTGAAIIVGGVGIGENLNVGGYGKIDDLYTKLIRSTEGPIRINPQGNNVTEIVGDIRVLGKNPIGTAPVVTNTLFVTMDGDDTNDGRAQDASRACRTITGAVNSPYYQPGTQIRVAAGHYLEDNPIQLKPYTSIMGSDLRTTSIEPINKTQDLFHLNSGCYLAFMQFLNGRSGLLEGPYLSEYNRGAYCTAFPPLTGDDRIDLYHSPYIQNCTNLSGPWLRDGTMFVPNQTVQMPLAVGVGTWPANTTSLVVSVSTGTISQGMKINAGAQSPGFFNARTLMLANKPFLQEQVVEFVDQTFSQVGVFVYNTTTCYRDVGLIVDSIALDLLQDSESESVFAGLQYWAQGNYTGLINEEILATTDTIIHLKDLAVAEALLVSSPEVALNVGSLFDVILSILNIGTNGVTDAIVSNGEASTNSDVVDAYEALQAAKGTFSTSTIAWIAEQIATSQPNFPANFTYNTETFIRDVAFIIDSVSFDLLHSGNKQSVKTAVYYYEYDASLSTVPAEIPQTTAAYNYIKSLISNIVKAEPIINTYQTSVNQITELNPASDYEVAALKNKIDIITGIIRNGPTSAPAKTPINLISNEAVAVQNAYALLLENKTFIQEEVIAYINTQFSTPFEYSREKCYRDVGILVENVAYDAAFGGNEKSVQAGLAYYDGVISRIAGQETQTISAIDYLNFLVQKVITNTPCPNLVVGPTYTQVINTVLLDGDVAGRSINDLFNIITNIIGNSPSAAPAIYKGTNVDAAFVSAEILMQANRKFIQEDTVNWINNTFMNFPYSKMTCRRDTGLIVDSIAFDLLHPTEGFSQSTFAGLQYWGRGDYVGTIKQELNPTIEAIKYLKALVAKIIKNITPADDLVNRYQTAILQDTSLESATTAEVTEISKNFDNIISILGGNSTGWTDKIISPKKASQLLGIKNAVAILMANKEYLAAEVTAFIDTTNFGFVYDNAKCQRDVGYMIDAVSFDLLHNSNRQSIQVGLYYYGFDINSITIQNQEVQTTAAFTFLGTIASDIVQGIAVTPLQTRVAQVLDMPLGDASAATQLSQAVSTITNIIANGPTVDYNATAIAMTASTVATVINAFDLLLANRSFIVEEVITYIDNTYNSSPFTYDQVKCERDTGLIVESIALDLLYNTDSESIFAGLQYWNQDGYTNIIGNGLTTTTAAINFAKSAAVSVANIAGGSGPAQTVSDNFDIITDILTTGPAGITDIIISNGTPIDDANITAAYNALIAQKQSIQFQTINDINTNNPGVVYNTSTVFRDIGFIIDSVAFDLRNGGNKQSIKSGVYYYNFDSGSTAIANEIPQTTAAYNFIEDIVGNIVKGEKLIRTFQNVIPQTLYQDPATDVEVADLERRLSIITNIIANGPDVAPSKIPMNQTASSSQSVSNAYSYLIANKDFIVAETVAFINATFSNKSFTYNEELCYRDVGLIVDAVSQDILLGGNYKTIEAGLSYWNQGYNYVAGQETTTTMAINYARDIALQIISNEPVIAQTSTETPQVINPFFQYGGDYMPQEAVRRNFNIITTIIENGPLYAPPRYMGGGLFAMTGINGADVLLPLEVTSVNEISTGTFVVGLNTATVGFGTNATLYFGDTTVIPYQDPEVEEISLQYTGNASTWLQRRVDPIGGMGGSLVDGAVISSRSPIQSFVYDAFTQLTQGGRGVRVTNDGYAQLVSVFTIFASTGVQVDNGGIASIVNSNANFGDICLVAKGYGQRKFTGTLYNPAFKAYPDSPGEDGLNQYYPEGFWPNNARVQVFVPDVADRPHISLVMEVEPPATYINEQGLPNFLNATPSIGVLATGTITITGVDTTGIAIGNTVYIRDQDGELYESNQYLLDEFGNPTATLNPNFGRWYAQTGTVVTDLGYQSVTLSNALTHGGGDPNNDNYFTLLFCGNAYYTVLSSQIADNPRPEGVNILSTASTGGEISQIPLHISALQYLNQLTDQVIANDTVVTLQTGTQASEQTFLPLVLGGANASTFIDLRFGETIDIIAAPNVDAAEAVIPSALRTRSGTIPAGAGSAVTLIEANIDFLADEIVAYVDANTPSETFTYNEATCRRDAGFIITNLSYDIALGSNYNAVTNGIAYRRGITSTEVVVGDQLTETLTAINYLKDRAAQSVVSDPIAVQRSNVAFTETLDIIAGGLDDADPIVFPNPTGVSNNLAYAKDLLVANKKFIQAEVIAWIKEQSINSTPPFITTFTYDDVKFAQDIGYIIDAVRYDLMFGSNFRSIVAGSNYYRTNSANTAGVLKTATLAALNQLKTLLLETVSGSVTAISRVNTSMNIIIDILDNGTGVAPTYVLPNPTGLGTGTINAKRLLSANKDFVIAEISAWIDEQIAGGYPPFDSGFVYNAGQRAKFESNIGFIIDAIRYDLTYGGNLESIISARTYFESTPPLIGVGEKAPTLSAYGYLSDVLGYIVTGVLITPSFGNILSQDTTNPGDIADGTVVQDRMQEINSTINAEGLTPSDILPSTSWVAPQLVTVSDNVNSAKSTIQSDIITFIDDNYAIFTFDEVKYARNFGYIVDALCYDVLYGGDSAMQDVANSYFSGGVSVIDLGERAPTSAAIGRLSTISQQVIRNIAVTTSPTNTVEQQILSNSATALESLLVGDLLSLVSTAITDDNLNGLPAKTYPDITWTSGGIQGAVAQLGFDQAAIIDQMIAYINDEFSGTFTYNKVKCRRDVRITLERLIYDLQTGGRYNSVMTGLSYWSRYGTHHIVDLGENVRRTDLFPDGSTVNFYQRSYISASGYVFEYVGAGTNYGALPQVGRADPVQGKETVQLDSGKVFFTSTDQNGDFRIGPGLVISQATGVLSGRTFTKSLFANLTPFILAIEGGAA